MRVVYLLASSTFGMHQYTADLANRMAGADHDVHLVTTSALPRDRYSPQVAIHTPVTARSTGFRPEGLKVGELLRLRATLRGLAPDLVHLTGVHAWNVLLVRWLRRQDIPVIHSLHDLDPHAGVSFDRLIRLWNQLIIRSADHLLVHGRIYRERLVAQGVPGHRVTITPLLHLFVSFRGFAELAPGAVHYERWALFFGRLEPYKGVGQLLGAASQLSQRNDGVRVVVAGQGSLTAPYDSHVPDSVEVRQRRIGDPEAIDLFQRCGLLVLPYLDASQSALIAAAYYFQKPVIVTDTGALAEYVEPGRTGWIVRPGDQPALAAALDEGLSDLVRLKRMGVQARSWYEAQRISEWDALTAMYRQVAGRDQGIGK